MEASRTPDYDLDPRSLVASLWRGLWLVVLTPLVFGAATYGFMRLYGPPARYESSVTLLAEEVPAGVRRAGDTRQGVDLDTEVLVATGFPVLARTAVLLGLLPAGPGWEAHWASPKGRAVLTDLEGRVSARREGGARVIRLTASAADPDGAQKLAGALAEAYQAERLIGRAARLQEIRLWLGERRAEAEAQLSRAAAELAAFLRQNREARLPEEQAASVARFSAALVDLDRTRRQLASTEALLAEMTRGDRAEPVIGLRLLEDDKSSVSVRLVTRYAELKAQREALLVGRLPGHPAVVAIDRQMAGLRDALRATVASEAASLARQVARQEALVEALRGEAAGLPPAAIRLAQLRREVALSEERVNGLARREHEAVAGAQDVFAELSVLRPPSVPAGPVGPTALTKALAGGALGLVVGCLLAIGLGNGGASIDARRWVRRGEVAAGVALVLLALGYGARFLAQVQPAALRSVPAVQIAELALDAVTYALGALDVESPSRPGDEGEAAP